MLYHLLNALAAAAVVREGVNLAGLIRSSLWLRRRPPDATAPQGSRLFIIIPVFEEQEIIEQTCRFFADMIEPWDNCFLVIVGTAREVSDNGRNPTLDAAALALEGRARCSVTQYPVSTGSKAEQLGHAVDSAHLANNDYIAVYDVDSRPDRNTLKEFFHRSFYGGCIFQQHALFLGNIDMINLRLLQVGQAVYQSRWTLAHEIPRFHIYNFGLFPFVHLVGHGLFVRSDILKKLGGFPTGTVVEDAHIGFYASAMRIRVGSLKSFDISDNPSSWKETFNQLYGWSLGPLDVRRYVASYRAAGHRLPTRQSAAMIAMAYFYWAQWAVTTPSILALLAAIALGNHLALLWLILYVADLGIAWLTLRRAKRVPGGFKAVLSAFAFAVICSIPAYAAFADRLLGRERPRYKSSHAPL